jgi:hypothetical protein
LGNSHPCSVVGLGNSHPCSVVLGNPRHYVPRGYSNFLGRAGQGTSAGIKSGSELVRLISCCPAR